MEHTADASTPPGPSAPRTGYDLARQFHELTALTVEDAASVVYTEALRQVRGNRTRAQDLAQSTWLKIIELLAAGRLSGQVRQPTAWLRQLVRRICIDDHRRDSADKRYPDGQVHTLDGLAPSDVPVDRAPTPDEVVLQLELRDSLRTVIAGIPPERRDVVLLVMRGHSFTEIATILEIPVGTAKTRFRAATKQLRGVIRLADS